MAVVHTQANSESSNGDAIVFGLSSHLIPQNLNPSTTHIFCDFDGTITDKDSLKWLLKRFGPKNWLEIERQLSDGIVSERDVLKMLFEHMSLDWDEAKKILSDAVSLDPGFRAFMGWAMSRSLYFKILSGGFTEVIDFLLDRDGMLGLPRVANHVRASRSGWAVSVSDTPRLCELCSHCKSWSIQKKLLEQPDSTIIYIGDGLSDVCAIHLADIIFAKGSLADYCHDKNIRHFRFSTFFEIKSALEVAFNQPQE